MIDPDLLHRAAEDNADLRAAMFRESPLASLERVALGLAWALKPERIRTLPPYLAMLAKDLLRPASGLPDPRRTHDDSGLAGIVHDLSVPTLIKAYRRGLYTAGHFGRLSWMSPPQRCVLFFDDIHISKRLRRLMRQHRYTVTFDRSFEAVIKACAGRREHHWHVTWITPRIMRAYAGLFDAGLLHSFEVWNDRDELAGGGYGVALGRIFFTESQFSHEDNTSKLGFTMLNWHLARWGYLVNDGKNPTPTILDMGFRNIPREEFLALLERGTGGGGKSGRWQTEAVIETVAAWEPSRKDPPDGGSAPAPAPVPLKLALAG
jgi:leucyl/phenylalanyl-tRNA--protein transferase